MIRFLLISIFFTLNFLSIAQPTPPPGGWDPSKTTSGTIAGIIVNAVDEAPIEYANVLVKDTAGNMVNGVITDVEGKFQIKNIPFDKLLNLEISFIGFQTNVTNGILLTREIPFLKVDKIVLNEDAELLKTVEITGERSLVQTSLDKKTYNVEKSTITKSKSASDVLAELPSVAVETDGTVSLRGNSNVRILIDGESSLMQSGNISLILQQIPAESIEKVDVITNPSAKYDPEGTSGIINIILKKEKQKGINGTVSAGVGTWNKYNASTFISYKKNKIGLTANYNFNFDDSYSETNSFRNTLLNGFESTVDQNIDEESDNLSHFGRIGLTISPNKKNSIAIGTFTNYFDFNRDQVIKTYSHNGEANSNEDTERLSLFNGGGLFSSTNIYHTINLKKEDAEVKYGANYSIFRGNFDGNYQTDSIISGDNFFIYQQKTQVDAIANILDVPIDFIYPVNERITEEFGFKGYYVWRTADFVSQSREDTDEEYAIDLDKNNLFIYHEQVYAAYGNHIQSYKNFSFQLGLRLEEVLIDASVEAETNSSFTRNYFSWYPSVFLRQSFGKDENSKHEVQISYSKRINRPSFRIVNPFRDYSDPLNPREGNPYLQPEFINAFEIGYNKIWDNVTFNSSLFYRLTTDLFSRVSTLIDEDQNIILTRYDNIGKSHAFGWELINKYKVLKWWDISLDFSLSKNYIKGSSGELSLSSDNFGYGGKINSTMNVWKGLEIQLIGRYKGPEVTAQGERKGYGTLDIALKQSILKNKGSISFTGSDLTNTQIRKSTTIGEGFTSVSEEKNETRIFWLTFSYGFGKMGEMFNKKNGKGSKDDGDKEEGVF